MSRKCSSQGPVPAKNDPEKIRKKRFYGFSRKFIIICGSTIDSIDKLSILYMVQPIGR